MQNIKKGKKGYVMLVSMLIIGVVGLSVVVSLLLLGIGSSRSSFSLEQSNKAKAAANACAEKSLQEIWNNDSYIGSGVLNIGQSSCSFFVTGDNISKTILVSGMIGLVTRKISITVDQLHPYLHVSSWQEIP